MGLDNLRQSPLKAESTVYDCEFQKSFSSQNTMLHNHHTFRPFFPTIVVLKNLANEFS